MLVGPFGNAMSFVSEFGLDLEGMKSEKGEMWTFELSGDCAHSAWRPESSRPWTNFEEADKGWKN